MSERPTNPPRAPASGDKAQRLRIRFARGPEAAAIGHLDLGRVWERALVDAGASLSYSQGARAQARLTLAAGLPVGVTSEGELLDVVLAERTHANRLADRVREHLPQGLAAIEVREVGIGAPSLPASVRWADYDVDVPSADGVAALRTAVEALLAASALPWEDTRGEKTRHYDLRSLVQELRVLDEADAGAAGCTSRLAMRLRCDVSGVGRPDQVVRALGLPEAARIHRKRLVLAEVSPAHDAWRRKGRFLG